MTEYKKIKILQVIILSLTSLLILLPPILANAQPMVHVRYNGTNKINYDGMTAHEFYKKTCDAINQQYKTMGKPSLTKPFKVTGSFKDLEAYTEEVYISPKNSYHATYKSGYTIKSGKLDACDIHIIPRQQNTIIYYAQRSSYKFDSSLPKGEQWVRDEMPGPTISKVVGNTMAGLWGFKMSPSTKKDMVASLFCETGEFSMGSKSEMVGSACVWRAKPEDHLIFLGHPLELVLSSDTQVGKGISNQVVADSVNLKEAYNSSIFQVPSTVKNMPFYADEPSYTKPEKDDLNLDCKAEKKKTGIDPCSSPSALAKWCKAELDKTGEDRCNNDDMDDESE